MDIENNVIFRNPIEQLNLLKSENNPMFSFSFIPRRGGRGGTQILLPTFSKSIYRVYLIYYNLVVNVNFGNVQEGKLLKSHSRLGYQSLRVIC